MSGRQVSGYVATREPDLPRMMLIESWADFSQGTKDIPFNIELPKDEIKLFTASVDAKLDIIDGGAHYLSASNPKEVDEKLIAFIKKYHKGGSKL
jgi:hypothetical protein